MVLAGSMLPDIIDKCILFFISGERLSSGRMFAHSLLFTLLFLALGMASLHIYRKSWVLVFAACSLVHQLLDVMWKQLDIFFWPLYRSLLSQGIQTFSPDLLDMPVKAAYVIREDLSWGSIWNLFSNPYIYISELTGALILLVFFILLVRRRMVRSFLKTGKVWNRKI
jgi:inner membrane protein